MPAAAVKPAGKLMVCTAEATAVGGMLSSVSDIMVQSSEEGEDRWIEGGESSRHLSSDRRRAFMKKLETVDESRPSWRAIVICISFDGRFVS